MAQDSTRPGGGGSELLETTRAVDQSSEGRSGPGFPVGRNRVGRGVWVWALKDSLPEAHLLLKNLKCLPSLHLGVRSFQFLSTEKVEHQSEQNTGPFSKVTKGCLNSLSTKLVPNFEDIYDSVKPSCCLLQF